jgi:hypothetical protein
MSSRGAAARAAVPATSTRAETSRLNGAKSRGPKTPEGKARSAQNALKHGMRAQKYLVLPDEDAAEFEALEAALVEELAPVGALQTVLARRVAVAAWRLARADRLVAETGLGPRSPTRRPTDRAVRGAEDRRRGPRARADPRRQRRVLVRDAAALSRRGHGGVLARAARPQGASGRADRDQAGGGLRVASGDRPASYDKRTRALSPAPARQADPRAQPRSARVAGDLATERTRADARQPAPAVVERAGARTIRRTRPCRNEE